MKYLVIYEFNTTVEHKLFKNQQEVTEFLKDKDKELCQDGDFVKYYTINGDFEINAGFLDRT